MKKFINRIRNTGIREHTPEFQAKAIVMANTIALITVTLSGIFLLYFIQNGWTWFDSLLLFTLILLSGIPALNRLGRTKASRFILSLAIPLTALPMTMAGRIQNPDHYDYTRSPGIYCALLASAVIPVLVFSSREKILTVFCLAINFILFVSLDPLFRYYSKQHEISSVNQFFVGNFALVIAYLLLVGSVLALKQIIDEYEKKNALLIVHLNEQNSLLAAKNRELQELNNNIETQNEEILSQSEELVQSQENLITANHEIERQKSRLEEQNEFLSKTLDERSKDLLVSNQQLIAQNNELHQFSYTVSHNLRGPVASMLGLLNIHRYTQNDEEKADLLHLLKQSAESLETVITDLNKVIEIRNDKFSIFENISLAEELSLVKQSLHAFITTNGVTIDSSFDVDGIRSIKTYIHSILYNLISNAIQYRAEERQAHIKVTTARLPDYTLLTVSDNGLGIDLIRFKADLFKLYKRFHTHTPGKGLGLYLVHQQVQKLNGRIEVKSDINIGTTFEIYLPVDFENEI
jgi:signal transduction histidine kinase